MVTDIFQNTNNIIWISLVIFLGSAFLTALIIPSIIKTVKFKNLMDSPNKRSSHNFATPTFGGLSFYIVLVLAFILLQYFDSKNLSIHIIASLTILFFTGLKDDLLVLSPSSKLISQVFAIILVLTNKTLVISNLHGFLGVNEISQALGLFISFMLMLTIINAYNLIDGIDGLAAIIGILIVSVFTLLFYKSNQFYFILLGFSIGGILITFLRFNLSKKNKIFMGDSGSLIVGLIISIMTLKFLTLSEISYNKLPFYINKLPIILAAILLIPLFDTSRVFVIRVLNKRSPFSADRNHIHHLLLDFGLSHIQASLFLGILNIIISVLFLLLATYNIINLKLFIVLIALSILLLLFFAFINRENKKSNKLQLDIKLFLKYSFDFIFSIFIILFLLTWLAPILYLIIKITTNEKLFYFQERIGKNGIVFKMIKFRTMKGSAPSNDPLLSAEEQHRITKVGYFLRKYRIDELPQFINVLKGEMSIVGPRPERQYFLNQIYKKMPKYKKMLKIRPGITSLGQIKFGYADNLFEMLQRARFDFLYINNINFYTDFLIILITIRTVFSGKGK